MGPLGTLVLGLEMDNDDTLKELFRTATQHPDSVGMSSDFLQKKSPSPSSASNPLLESILAVQKTSSNTPPSERSNSSVVASQSGGINELTAVPTNDKTIESISCETINISQVKHPSHQSPYGRIISVTGRAIAYVLNDRKIRFIAQENASMGLMDSHDPTRLPVVDLAWYGQNEGSNEGDLNIPSSNLLASLTKGAEVRIGAVFSDSSTSLAYEGLFASIFPELAPARGLTWGCIQGSPLLAVFGEDPDIFLISLQGTSPKVVYVSTGIADIQAIHVDSTREILTVAGLLKVESFKLSDLDDIVLVESFALSEGVRNAFLVVLSQGPAVVATTSGSKLIFKELYGEKRGLNLNLGAFTNISSSAFVQADPTTNIICVGCYDSDRINFFKAGDGAEVVTSGVWPNKGNAISVCSSGQLHSIYEDTKKVSLGTSTFFLYAYSQDSVKMHHFVIDWSKKGCEISREKLSSYKPRTVKPSSVESLSQSSENIALGPESEKSSMACFQATSRRVGLEDPREAIGSNVLERSFEKLATSLASDLEKSCQKAVRDACQRMKIKPAEVAALVQPELTSSLAQVVENSIRVTVEKQWLKGIQDTIAASISQLSDRISQAILDASQTNHRMVMRELVSINERLELQSSMIEALPSGDQLQGLLHVPTQAEHKTPNEAQIREQVTSLIQSGNAQEALIQVLEEGSLPLLNWALEILDVSLVVKDLPIKATLSLIQQIGHDLSSKTEIKLSWLSEILAEFDPRAPSEEPSLAQTMDAVFEEVFSNLRVLFAQTPSPSALHKQTRLIMRLLRGAMTS